MEEIKQSEFYFRLPPEFLYRYRSFDEDKNNLKLFTHNELFCASPKHFNDAMDCKIPMNFFKGNKREAIGLIECKLRDKSCKLDRKEIREKARLLYKNAQNERSNDPTISFEHLKSIADKYFGIFSLTELENSSVMWHRYGQDYQGFLVEFNAIKLQVFLSEHGPHTNQSHMLFPVRYSSELPVMNSSKHFYKEMMNLYLTKSTAWLYEKEWRIVFADGADKPIIIPKKIFNHIITKVIIGLNSSSDNRDKLISVLERKNIPYKSVVQSNSKYELNYV